ncbi:MAG: hypothetical protein J6S09_00665 [Paludibacteraceae bacterium]|nr:hypothetical protein [Paludibacteraceae bacterium]
MKKITLFLSAMLFSVMSFAGVITFTPGEFDALESSKFDVEKDGVTLSCTSGTITADQFRFFKSQTLTVSSTAGNITSIEFTCTAANETKHGPGGFGELEGYSYADKVGTWAGSAASVTFSATNNQVRATQVVVTIDGEGGGETPDTPVDPEEPETPVDPENPDTPEEPETPVGSIDGYSKVTNAASLVAGDKVVLYCDDAQLGVTGWNGNKDATVAESGWVEYVVEVADGGFYLKDGEQYISLTTKNTFTYKTTGSVCKVTSEGILYITLEGVDYLLYENGGQYYRMYTDKSSNSAYKPFYVYKAGEGGGETPDPENPENPDPEQPDPENPNPENPDPENPEPENPETPSGEVTFDADVDNEGVGTDSSNATAYSVTKNGVTMTVSSGILGTYNNENHYRVYKNQTLTLTSTAGNIVKVEFTCTANDETKYGPGCFTASTGDYTWSGPVGTWTGSASEVVFTATTNQVRATQVVVTLGEGGGETPDPEDPEQPEEPGDVEIKGLVYADAYYYEYDGVAYYDIDMYKDIDMDTYEYTYPEVYVSLEAKSKTALNGTYDVWYAGYWKSANDSVEINETTPGTITIKNTDNEGNYSVSGSFVGTDGKTYSFNDVVSVWAFDFDNYEEITLSEDGSDTPDTPDNPDTPVTPEGMITCAEAATIAAAENYKGTENVTVYGYVVELGNQKVDDKTGRNKQTFYMSDTKGGDLQFMAYWAFVPDFFEVGDKVAITGILQNYKGTIEIADGEAVLLNETGVDDVLVENTPVKVIKNAQMYIMQGNKVYTIMGTQVK